jgi:hypothetical protein
MAVDFTTADFPSQHNAVYAAMGAFGPTDAAALSRLGSSWFWVRANAVPTTTRINLALDMTSGLDIYGTAWDSATNSGQNRWVYDNGDFQILALQGVNKVVGPPFYTGTQCSVRMSYTLTLRARDSITSTVGSRSVVQSSLSIQPPAPAVLQTKFSAIRAGSRFAVLQRHLSLQPDAWHIAGDTMSYGVTLYDRPDNWTAATGWDDWPTVGGTIDWSAVPRRPYYQTNKVGGVQAISSSAISFSGQQGTAEFPLRSTLTDSLVSQWGEVGGMVANPRAGSTLYWDPGAGALYPLEFDVTTTGFGSDYRPISYAGRFVFTW